MTNSKPDKHIATASDPRGALAGWYLRPRFGIVTLLPLLAGLSVCMLLALLRGAGEDPRANLRISMAAMLAQAPPPVPPAENAAVVYNSIGAVYAPFSNFDKKGYFLILHKSSKRLEAASVKAYLQANAPALILLQAAAQKPLCNFGLNYGAGAAMAMTHFGKMREYARFLVIDARAKAHAGDHAGAAADIETIYTLAGHVISDPLLLSGLVAVVIENLADDCIQDIVVLDTLTQAVDIEQYRRVHRLDRDPKGRCMRSLAAERAYGLCAIDQLAAGAVAPSRVLPRAFQGANVYTALSYSSDRRRMIAVMDDYLKRTETNELDNGFDAAQQDAQLSEPSLLANDTLLSARTFLVFWRDELQARLTDTGLAILLFRASHGRDPASLDELVPKFLPHAPEDPVSHQSLMLQHAPMDNRPGEQLWRQELATHFNGHPMLFIRTPRADVTPSDGAPLDFILPPLGAANDGKADKDD